MAWFILPDHDTSPRKVRAAAIGRDLEQDGRRKVCWLSGSPAPAQTAFLHGPGPPVPGLLPLTVG